MNTLSRNLLLASIDRLTDFNRNTRKRYWTPIGQRGDSLDGLQHYSGVPDDACRDEYRFVMNYLRISVSINTRTLSRGTSESSNHS